MKKLYHWSVLHDSTGLSLTGYVKKENKFASIKSCLVTKRISKTHVETENGEKFILHGSFITVNTNLPHEFCQKFDQGFPLQWRKLNSKLKKKIILLEDLVG